MSSTEARVLAGADDRWKQRQNIWFLRSLTFELSRHRRWDARPGLAKMYRVPPDRAWWPAVGARLERGVRPHKAADECIHGADAATGASETERKNASLQHPTCSQHPTNTLHGAKRLRRMTAEASSRFCYRLGLTEPHSAEANWHERCPGAKNSDCLGSALLWKSAPLPNL